MLKSASMIVALALVAGCDSGGSTSNGSLPDDAPLNGTRINGVYDMSAMSTTQFSSDGGACGDASGTMTVTDSRVSGMVATTTGNALGLTGSVDSNGRIVGGFALGDEVEVSFEGTISAASGSGTWRSNYGCTGTWSADRDDSDGSGFVVSNDGPWIGSWVQVNFLGDSDNGIWDADDPLGIGFVAQVTDTTWTETDEFGDGCSVIFEYTVDANFSYVKRARSVSNDCPFSLSPILDESGTLLFSGDNTVMEEYFITLPGDTLIAFRWKRL